MLGEWAAICSSGASRSAMERRRVNGGWAMAGDCVATIDIMFSIWAGGSLLRGNHEPVSGLEDLVKDAAVGEMRFLRLLPAAENLVHRDEFHRAELAGIFRRGLFRTRTVKIPAGDFLAFVGVKVFEIGL